MTKQPTLKILVAYHKPATLIKNDIFVPIHVGRSVAKEASKDGVISDKDLKWLQDNMIGDDTGDNISHLNRYFCELTAIYWAWKNYDKLGNPDFIGLCHYSRFFHFFPNFSRNFNKLTAQKFAKILGKMDCIFPELHTWDTLEQPFDHHQILVGLSEKYYPNLYHQYQAYKARKDKKTFICNMFILKKEDFFTYCETIFDILFKIHNTPNLIKTTQYHKYIYGMLADEKTKDLAQKSFSKEHNLILLPRIYGYIAEILSSFIFWDLIKKKRKALILPFTGVTTISENPIGRLPLFFLKMVSSQKGQKLVLFKHLTLWQKRQKKKKCIYRLFGVIPVWSKKTNSPLENHNTIWRQRNPHNETTASNEFDMEKVSVGRATYGKLCVETAGDGPEKLLIGNYCSIGPNVHFILSSEHDYKNLLTYPFKVKFGLQSREAKSKGNIVIEDDVWIGLGSIINSGCHIGQGAIIASGSVVVNDVEPYSIVGGNPAKHIKYRFDENIRNKLININFEKLDKATVYDNLDLLYTELTEKNIDKIINTIIPK